MRERQAGYTMIEVAVVSAIVLSILAAVGGLFGVTDGLRQQTRAHSRASSDHRRNLEALANVLRTADLDTLDGFDHEGIATTPRFLRVTGVDLADRTYEDPERLVWMPETRAVDGVEEPGNVYLVSSGTSELVAARVPAGGFAVRQEGASLAIRLTTYYVTDAHHVATITGETAVSLRN